MSDEEEMHAPNAPKPIHRLEEALVNRIAAGEIIHRPSSALKELLENALDAGSTTIQLIAKDGGLKLLQLRDNGCGIRREDLPILAERFTTSKLSQFDDLRSLETYGFRGEALASISFVAQLSVVTKTRLESCAWKAYYANGALAPPKAGQTAEPKPCAGTDGTIITVENLFYNTPVRLAALRNPSDEYGRLLDVMTKYAVHKPTVSFTCRKSGAAQPDLNTPGGPSATARDNIHRLYGASVSNALIRLEAEEQEIVDASGNMVWHYEALCSNASYAGKSLKLILFINGRLVESQPFKRAIEAVYAPILAKGSHPFVYLSLSISPECLDVNVHPTKREVRFLHEDEVVDGFTTDLFTKLAEQAQSRPFAFNTQKQSQSQARLQDDMSVDEDEAEQGSDADEELPTSTQGPRRVYSQHKVRTSNKDRSLDSMLVATSSEPAAVRTDSGGPGHIGLKTASIPEAATTLLSILNLRKAVKDVSHSKLRDILSDHTFVGLVDAQRALSLVQHGTRLYLLNHAIVSEELFYQLGLRQFSAYQRVALNPAPPLRRLIRIGLDAELKRRPSKQPLEVLEDKIYKVLMKRREMLDVHFSIRIDESGELKTLPMLLPGYVPNMTKLPLFAMRLGPQVNWSDEQQCFQTLLREIAMFYSLAPAPFRKDKSTDKDLAWQVQHLILAQCRTDVFDPPVALLEHALTEVANLPALYRVFERC